MRLDHLFVIKDAKGPRQRVFLNKSQEDTGLASPSGLAPAAGPVCPALRRRNSLSQASEGPSGQVARDPIAFMQEGVATRGNGHAIRTGG